MVRKRTSHKFFSDVLSVAVLLQKFESMMTISCGCIGWGGSVADLRKTCLTVCISEGGENDAAATVKHEPSSNNE